MSQEWQGLSSQGTTMKDGSCAELSQNPPYLHFSLSWTQIQLLGQTRCRATSSGTLGAKLGFSCTQLSSQTLQTQQLFLTHPGARTHGHGSTRDLTLKRLALSLLFPTLTFPPPSLES